MLYLLYLFYHPMRRSHFYVFQNSILSFLTLAFLLSAIAPAFSQQKLSEGRLIWLPFEGNAIDRSGNDQNGTVVGASLATDRFGNANHAYFFDGMDDYIDIPATTLQNSQYSYSLWANPMSMPYEGATSRLLSIGGPGGDQDVSLGNGYVAISKGWDGAGYNTDGTVNHYSVGTLPVQNTWYLTRDGNALKLYVNGQLVGSDVTYGKLPYYGYGQVNAIIGTRSTFSQYFHGMIDDVAIYNRALTAQEVTDLYNAPNPVAEDCQASGTILREYWANVKGGETSKVPVDKAATSTSYLTSFEAPSNVAENYASRIRGYLCAPETGNYTFWIASDDYGDLYLSTNDDPANKQLIAYIKGWSHPRQWNKHFSQKSAPVYLEKGKRYYIEALHKEAWVMDNLAVGWRLPSAPGNTAPTVIPGSVLSPFVPGNLREESVEFGYPEITSTLQAYPNPFSDQLNIHFTPQETGSATLEMYDTRGYKISTLFDGAVELDQEQKIEFNGNQLSQGFYIIRLVNGAHTQHVKVALMP
jgi:hypothetical protein